VRGKFFSTIRGKILAGRAENFANAVFFPAGQGAVFRGAGGSVARRGWLLAFPSAFPGDGDFWAEGRGPRSCLSDFPVERGWGKQKNPFGGIRVGHGFFRLAEVDDSGGGELFRGLAAGQIRNKGFWRGGEGPGGAAGGEPQGREPKKTKTTWLLAGRLSQAWT